MALAGGYKQTGGYYGNALQAALARDYKGPEINNTLSLVGKVEEGLKDLPSWIPDYSVAHKPKAFESFGCSKFRAAISTPPLFEVLERDFNPPPSKASEGEEGKKRQKSWVLNVSAAYFDTIEQVGENLEELSLLNRLYFKGHLLELITKLDRYYAPTGERTILACARTLIADLSFRTGIDDGKLTNSFIHLLGETFNYSKAIAPHPGLMSTITILRPIINKMSYEPHPPVSGFLSFAFSTPKLVDAFVEKHDCELYGLR
ncbi:hypothetical protein AOQ84DRAFT_379609 [Glonium stellatum]|uniref:Uncharacterized protein n=1 Tax=Glonium stellatum TaxID=574774 RepID=A0A8E2JQ28_9PEZI|nr:hypothetical protein AOQ84DRAFT_379609 [Glonium stellatum]